MVTNTVIGRQSLRRQSEFARGSQLMARPRRDALTTSGGDGRQQRLAHLSCGTPPAELPMARGLNTTERRRGTAGCLGYRADESVRDRRVMGQLGRGLAADSALAAWRVNDEWRRCAINCSAFRAGLRRRSCPSRAVTARRAGCVGSRAEERVRDRRVMGSLVAGCSPALADFAS
jgi:hypothetical protein